MRVCSYRTMLHEDGTPYLMEDRSYESDDRRIYSTPEEITDFILTSLRIQDCAEEYLYVLCFDTGCHLIGCCEASHGTVSTSLVSNREILQKALLIGAVCIAVTHNHPSGDTTPSECDIQATSSLKDACSLLGIGFMDHIIVSQESWCSLKEQKVI